MKTGDKYIIHITKTQERWDSIAYKYYGNCYKIAPLIMSNPHLAIGYYIPAGSEVIVPVRDNKLQTNEKNEELPPWKTREPV